MSKSPISNSFLRPSAFDLRISTFSLLSAFRFRASDFSVPLLPDGEGWGEGQLRLEIFPYLRFGLNAFSLFSFRFSGF
jgi:hypothetical protein